MNNFLGVTQQQSERATIFSNLQEERTKFTLRGHNSQKGLESWDSRLQSCIFSTNLLLLFLLPQLFSFFSLSKREREQ